MEYSDLYQLVGQAYCSGVAEGMQKSAGLGDDIRSLANYANMAGANLGKKLDGVTDTGEILRSGLSAWGGLSSALRGKPLLAALGVGSDVLGGGALGAGAGALGGLLTGDGALHGAEVGGRIGGGAGLGGGLGGLLGGFVGRRLGGSFGDGTGAILGRLLGGGLGAYGGYKLPSISKSKKNSED